MENVTLNNELHKVEKRKKMAKVALQRFGATLMAIIWPGIFDQLIYVPGVLRETAGGERGQPEFQQLHIFRKIHL